MVFASAHFAAGLQDLVSWLVEHCIAELSEQLRHSGLEGWSGSRSQKYLPLRSELLYLLQAVLLVPL